MGDVVYLDLWRMKKNFVPKTYTPEEKLKHTLDEIYAFVEDLVSEGISLDSVTSYSEFLELWEVSKKQGAAFSSLTIVIRHAIRDGLKSYEEVFEEKVNWPTLGDVEILLSELRFGEDV